MNIKFFLFALILIFSFIVNSVGFANELASYQQSINRTCLTSADCVVKDVGNCCGYYPECVNINTKTNPELVKTFCEKEGMASICGFESITKCDCVENICQSHSSSSLPVAQ